MAIIALLLGLLLPALAKARSVARQNKDATQIQQVHKAFLTYATGEGNGKFPCPARSTASASCRAAVSPTS